MKQRDPIETVSAFANSLKGPRQCYFLAFEGLVTGGLVLRSRAWLAERALDRFTKKPVRGERQRVQEAL